MADVIWIGGATAVAQVDTFTPATIEVGDVFTLTATGEDGSTAAVSFVATDTTAATTAAGLIAAWNASTNALHTPVTASGSSTVILTADTAGVPFYVAGTTTNGGAADTQTLTRAATTPSKGPNDWNTANNWLAGAIPVDADNVYIDGRADEDIIYGLQQTSIDLALLRIKAASSVDVGTTTAALSLGTATVVKIHEAAEDGSSPAGSSLIHLNTGTNAATIEIFGSRNAGTDGLAPIVIKGAHASNVLRIRDGVVGIATGRPGDTANFPTIQIDGGNVMLGSGCTTPTTLKQTGGKLRMECSAGTLDQLAGELRTEGSGTITTANIGGTFHPCSSGAITTLNVESGATADFDYTFVARTVSAANLYGTGRIIETNNTVTWTAGIDLLKGAKSTQVDFGTGRTVTPSAL